MQPGYPPPPPSGYGYPPGYYPGMVPPGYGPPRPTSPKTLGVLSIVFGSLVALFSLFGAIVNRGGGFKPQGISTGAWQRYLDEIATAAIAMSTLLAAMSIALIVIGVGQRGYKRWAGKASVVWALAALAFLAVQAVVNFAVMIPAMERVFADLPSAAVRSTATGAVKIGVFVSLAFYLPYPIILLVTFRKPATVAAMDQD